MAVPRNQVAISGFVDPYAKLSGTFKDLSSMYADKAARDQDAALKEQALARQSANDLENSRRWGVENSRIESQKAKEEALKKAVWGVYSGNNKYGIDAYSPQLQDNINRSINSIKSQDTLATSYLTSDNEDKKVLNTISQNYRDMYKGSGLDETALDSKVADNITRLQALKREVGAIGDPKKVQDRIETFRKRQFEEPLLAINEAVDKGTALTTDQRIGYYLRNLPAEQRMLIDPIALKGALAGAVGGRSREEMLTSETARVEKIEKARQQNVDNLLEWADKTGFDRDKAFGSAATTAAEKIMDGLDIGSVDTPRADAFYRALVSEGVAPVFAANYTMGKVDTNILGSSFVSPTSREGSKMIAEAVSQYAGLESRYNKNGKLTKDDIEVKLIAPRSFDELQYNNFRVNNTTSPIQVASSFLTPPVKEVKATVPSDIPREEPVAETAPVVTPSRENLSKPAPSMRAEALRARRETQEELNKLIAERNNLSSLVGRTKVQQRAAEEKRLDEQIRMINARMDVIRKAIKGQRTSPAIANRNNYASRP
jgi:hypothetical protein